MKSKISATNTFLRSMIVANSFDFNIIVISNINKLGVRKGLKLAKFRALSAEEHIFSYYSNP